MPVDANGKNSLSQNNHSLIQDIHFAICPFVVQNFDGIKNIFTLNFEKDNQIVGELSTMICPQQQKNKVDIDMMKNIMFFRVFKDKLFRYKWSLYQRDMKGKEKFVQNINISIEKEVQQFTNRLLKSRNNSSSGRKNSINQSRTLSVSSKVNQSRQKQKQKQIIMNKRKKSLKNLQIETSRESKEQKSQQGMYLKEMKCKFIKSEVKLGFLLCMGMGQDQIRGNVQRFHLQSKLKIISKSFGDKNVDNKIENNTNIGQSLKQVTEDREQHVNSNKQIEVPVVKEYNIKTFLQVHQDNSNQNNQKRDNKLQQQPVREYNIQEKQWSLKNGQLPQNKQEILQKQSQPKIQHIQRQQPNILPLQPNPKKSQPQKRSQQSLLDDVILHGKRFSVEEKSDWMRTSKSKTSQTQQNKNSSNNLLNPLRRQQQQPKLHLKLSNNLQLVSKNNQNQNQPEDLLNSFKPASKNGLQNKQNQIQDSDNEKVRKNLSQTGNDGLQYFEQNYLKAKQIKIRRKFTPDEYHSGMGKNSPSFVNVQIKINKQNPIITTYNNDKAGQIKQQQNNHQLQNDKDINNQNNHHNQLFYQQSPENNDTQYHQYQQVITPAFNEVQVSKNNIESGNLFTEIQKAWQINSNHIQFNPSQTKQSNQIPLKQVKLQVKQVKVIINNQNSENITQNIIIDCQQQQQQGIQWGHGLSQIKQIQHLNIDNIALQISEQEEEDDPLQKIYHYHIRPIHQKYFLPLQQNIQQKISQNQHSQKFISYVNTNKSVKYLLIILLIFFVSFIVYGLIAEETKVLSKNDPIFKKKTNPNNKSKREKYKKKK